ncbi:MAG: hypothetical protein N3E52_04805 [Candidatus Bathyarchaeota archaeon]|nr:hypothetical protein [Candidatus Bathyarchaeota archaeon]
MKGSELLDIYGQMYGMARQECREQIPKLIELVGLKGRENDPIGKYSKGMQQRIGIAQTLLNDPELRRAKPRFRPHRHGGSKVTRKNHRQRKTEPFFSLPISYLKLSKSALT